MPLNQCLLFAAGLYLTFAFGMLNFMFLCIHVIYSQYFKLSADIFQHISFDMKHDNLVILVIKNIGFLMKYYFTFQYVVHQFSEKSLKPIWALLMESNMWKMYMKRCAIHDLKNRFCHSRFEICYVITLLILFSLY